MTSRLQLYQGALRILGSEAIASLTDNVEARRVLDDVWADNAVQYCLETGYWTHATRAVKLGNSPDVTTKFGYTYAFNKPTDYIKLFGISLNEFWTIPLVSYADEAAYWYANVATLYIKFISSDPLYGMNMGIWPQSFVNLVEAYMAMKANMRITKSEARQKLADDTYKAALRDARSKDNMNQPAQFMPAGSWVRGRANGKLSSQYSGLFNSLGSRDY